MVYTVSITSQGQISIPAPLRKKLGLNKLSRALVTEKDGQVLIRPIRDLLDLRGSLKTNKKPPASSEIHEAYAKYRARKVAQVK